MPSANHFHLETQKLINKIISRHQQVKRAERETEKKEEKWAIALCLGGFFLFSFLLTSIPAPAWQAANNYLLNSLQSLCQRINGSPCSRSPKIQNLKSKI